MDERAACALLKARFEAAGYYIEENQQFEEAGVRFEIDGFDAARRVGYEYITAEAGDGWDVDGAVVAALAERRKKGELFVLVVEESDAPDAAALGARADTFLAELPDDGGDDDDEEADEKPATAKAPAKKPAAKPAAKKPAAKKPAKKAPAKRKRR